MEVSVVVPTRNRRDRVRLLLRNLAQSHHPVSEVVVVDSSDERMQPAELLEAAGTPDLRVRYLHSQRPSVCVQRNIGIREAHAPWVFLCDDDIEVPPDYLSKLSAHVAAHPGAGAVSGIVLEVHGGRWLRSFPVASSPALLWRFVFQQGIWGEIEARGPWLTDRIVERYRRRGNHISRAGWPVIADFSGEYFRTPIYGLGASLVRRDWLLASPYDERLESHGIGDNYGVALGFPAEGIHVLNGASVRHHKESVNRLSNAESYALRLLALHYFVVSRRVPAHVRTGFFLWSLIGQVAFHASVGDRALARAGLKTLLDIARGNNPYLKSQ
jgi:glycosyltransferase involved in cell wall biosynthesis